jgi:hypothetical protein
LAYGPLISLWSFPMVPPFSTRRFACS